MSEVNANINILVNTAQASARLRELTTQINSLNRNIASTNSAAAAQQASLNRALVDGINSSRMFNASIVPAIDSVGRFSNALEKNKLSLGEYTKYAMSQLPGMRRMFANEWQMMEKVATERVKRINTQYLAMGKNAKGLQEALKIAPTALGAGLSTEMAVAAQRAQLFNKMIDDGSTKLLNWGKNTQWAGRQLMVGFSLPLAALGSIAAKTFMELDKATLSLERVYGDLNTSTAEVERNSAAIQELGKEYTKYGIAVSETIGIGARAAATGAQNETLLAATEQTLRFATLGQIEYQQALDTTISLQTAFGISNDELANKINFLNAVENQTILTIEDMSLAIPRVATVVKGLGGSVEDLAVMMTALREGGVSAENGANALKSGLASLINPTDRATASLNSMGINLQQIISENRGNLMGLIKDFGTALNSIDEFSRQQVLEQVFGKYQYAKIGALFTNIASSSSQAARAMELAGRSAEDLAAISEKELDKISETTTVKFQAAMESLKVSIAPLGEAFLKGVMPIMEALTKIADAFNNLPDGVKNAIAVITGVVAGLGPVFLMTIGLIGNGVANLVKGFQFIRKTLARIKGDASAFTYLADAELDAVAAANTLEGKTHNLTNALQLQQVAVAELVTLYSRLVGAMTTVPSMVGGGARGGATVSGPRTRGAVAGRGGMPMARGGVVPGAGNKDTVPALLTPGETVVTKKATQKYGPILSAMNAGTLPGFAQGVVSIGDNEVAMEMRSQAQRRSLSEYFSKIVAELVEDGVSLDVAVDRVTSVMTEFAATGERVNRAKAKQLMEENALTRSSRSLVAAHMTGAMPLDSPAAQAAMSTLRPELREFIAQNQNMTSAVSKLTVTIPALLNEQLKEKIGRSGQMVGGATIEQFRRGWEIGGADKLYGAAVAGGARLEDPGVQSALQQMEQEIRERAIVIAQGTERQRVTDSIVEQAAQSVIDDYERLESSVNQNATANQRAANQAAASALRTSATTVGQFRIQPTAEEVRAGLASGNYMTRGRSIVDVATETEVARTKSGGGYRPGSNIQIQGGLATATAQQQADALERTMIARAPAIGTATVAAMGTTMIPATSALGVQVAQTLNRAVESGTQDAYILMRDRNSPHAQVAPDANADATTYAQTFAARTKALIQGAPKAMATPVDKFASATKSAIMGVGPLPDIPKRLGVSPAPLGDMGRFARSQVAAKTSAGYAKAAVVAGSMVGAQAVDAISSNKKAFVAAAQTAARQSAPTFKGIFAAVSEPFKRNLIREAEKPVATAKGRFSSASQAGLRGGGLNIIQGRAPMSLGGEISQITRGFGSALRELPSAIKGIIPSIKMSAKDLAVVGKVAATDIKASWQPVSAQFGVMKSSIKSSFDSATTAIKTGGRSLSAALSEAAARLKTSVTGAGLTPEQNAERRSKMQGRMMGAGMAMSMASMAPMMMQNANGKFMGMDAGTASMGLMGGGMLLSMVGMVPGPLLAVAAAAGGAGIAFKALTDNANKAAEESAKLGESLGAVANSSKILEEALGVTIPKAADDLFRFSEKDQQAIQGFQDFFAGDQGKQFIQDLNASTSEEKYKKVSYMIAKAIGSGTDPEKAKQFGLAIAQEMGDALLAGSIAKDFATGIYNNISELLPNLIDQRLQTGKFTYGGVPSPSLDLLGNATGATFRAPALESLQSMFGDEKTKQNVENIQTAYTQLGFATSVIGDITEAEAILDKQRRDGAITIDEYQVQSDKLENSRKEALAGISQSIKYLGTSAPDIKAGLQNYLKNAGFDEQQITDLIDKVAPEDLAQKIFSKSYKDLSDAQKKYVDEVFANTLSGITPENVDQKLLDIEGTWKDIAERAVQGIISGLESSKDIFNEKEISDWIGSRFGTATTRIGAGQTLSMAKNLVAAQPELQKVGTDMFGVQSAINQFKDDTFAKNILSSKDSIIQLGEAISGLNKFKTLDVETAFKRMKEQGYTAAQGVYSISNGIEKISKMKFKKDGFFGDPKKMLPNPEDFYYIMLSAGKEIAEIPSIFEKSFNQTDVVLDKFGKNAINKLGNIKPQIIPEILPQLFGNSLSNPAEVAANLQSAFPQGLNPIQLMIMVGLGGPGAALLSDPKFKEAVLSNKTYSETQAYTGSGLQTLRTEYTPEQLAMGKLFYGYDNKSQYTLPEKKKPKGDGGKDDPVKDFVNTLKERLMLYTNLPTLLAKLKGKKDQIEKLLPQIGFSNTLGQQMRKAGLNENVIADILSKGYKDAQKIWNSIKGRVQQTNRMEIIGGIGANIEALTAETTANSNKKAVSAALERRGFSQEEIDGIIQDTQLVNQLSGSLKMGGKEFDKWAEKKRTALSSAIKEPEDVLGTLADELDASHERIVASINEQIDGLNEQVKIVQKEIDALKELNNADQERISGLERQKEMIQRQIAALERANEMDQRRVDALRREDELRNRTADALSHELELMSQREQEIRDSYQKRIDALDQVAKINDHIISQQKNQLNLAQAFSQGDIYAAAQAAQEMQAQQVQYAAEQNRNALQQGMEGQIAGLTTAGGLTRQQAEAQIAAIKEQSYQTSLQIRDIEDQIYARNQAIIPLKDQQYQLDLQIQAIQDIIYQRNQEIKGIEDSKLAPLNEQIAKLNERIAAEDKSYANAKAAIKQAELLIKATGRQKDAALVLAQQWENVLELINAANEAAKSRTAVTKKALDAGIITEEEYAKQIADIENERQAAIDKAYGKGNAAISASATPANMATGGIVGAGARDSVPAMLSPGEFVMRRSAVKKYGATMFEKMNIGSFAMPQYDVARNVSMPVASQNNSASISAPVYNTYSINVPVTQPNASADDIANKVLTKIRNIENSSIRRISGY